MSREVREWILRLEHLGFRGNAFFSLSFSWKL